MITQVTVFDALSQPLDAWHYFFTYSHDWQHCIVVQHGDRSGDQRDPLTLVEKGLGYIWLRYVA